METIISTSVIAIITFFFYFFIIFSYRKLFFIFYESGRTDDFIEKESQISVYISICILISFIVLAVPIDSEYKVPFVATIFIYILSSYAQIENRIISVWRPMRYIIVAYTIIIVLYFVMENIIGSIMSKNEKEMFNLFIISSSAGMLFVYIVAYIKFKRINKKLNSIKGIKKYI